MHARNLHLLPLLAALLAAACNGEAPRPSTDSAGTARSGAAAGGAPATDAPPAPGLAPSSLADTPNVHVFDGVLTSGQPTLAGFEAARALGVKSVLNHRKPEEMAKLDFDERAVVEGLGMTYEVVPFGGADELTDEVLDRVRVVLRDAPRPALYHCASANRVGAGWAAWRALDGGLDIEAALAEGRQVGLRSPAFEPKVRDYVARRRATAGG